MPPPINISAATAVELGPLPNSISQRVDDSGTTYTVWYKYTAQPGDDVVGIFAFGDLVTYTARIKVFSPDGLTSYLDLGASAIIDNHPIAFAVTPGQVYYFQISSPLGNVSPANLVIDGLKAPKIATLIPGSLIVNQDDPGYPATILSVASGAVLGYRPAVVGESGATLDDGTICLSNEDADGADPHYELPEIYDAQLVFQARVNQQFSQIGSNGTNFYGLQDVGIGNILQIFDKNGVLGRTWTVGVNSILDFAVSRDGSILYYRTGSGANLPVKRWNLLTDTAMSVLYTLSGGNFFVTALQGSLLALEDDTLIVGEYIPNTSDHLLHIAADGTLLATWDQGANRINKMTRGLDDPTSFWVWLYPGLTGSTSPYNRYRHIKVSDGSIIADVDVIQYESGRYMGVATATPLARFGPSLSCPFVILREAPAPPAPGAIYFISLGKTNDTLYYSNYFTNSGSQYYYSAYQMVVKIPNPFFILPLI